MSTPRLPGPRGLAQLGPLRRIFSTPHLVLDELAAEHGGIVGLGFGPARLAIVGDPALLAELFATPVESFRWNHKFNVLGFVVGPGSMITSDGDDHKRRRASVQAAFSRRRLNGWIPLMLEEIDAAVDGVLARGDAGASDVDLYPVVRLAVLRVAVRAFFGERLAGRAEEIGALFQGPQDYLEATAIHQIPHPLPFTRRSRVRADRRALDAIIDGEIAACRRAPSGDPLDVLEALVLDGTMSDAEIRDQVVTLIGAGYDTTAASLAWSLWCAALEPDVWAQLRAEGDAVLGPPDDVAAHAEEATVCDHTTLAALRFADQVVHETLRLHPAGVISPREAAVDVRLGDHVVRRGTLILWSAHLAGRNASFWPDPLRFDPDRFADATPEQQAAARAAWVPFGGGARNCIGFALAQMELTIMISRLAQRLDVIPSRSEAPPPVGMVVNRPSGGVPMQVVARTS